MESNWQVVQNNLGRCRRGLMQWWRVEKNGLGEEIENKMRGLMEIQGMEEQ